MTHTLSCVVLILCFSLCILTSNAADCNYIKDGNNNYLTLVLPGVQKPWGIVYNITLTPATCPESGQQWCVTGDGYIESQVRPGVVFDAENDVTTDTRLIGYLRKTPPAPNQLFDYDFTSGVSTIKSRKAPDYYAYRDSSSYLRVGYTGPYLFYQSDDSCTPTTAPTIEPTISPTDPPTRPPTTPPTIPPTIPPTDRPTASPTQPPTVPPTRPPTRPPTIIPTQPPTAPPTKPPTAAPVTSRRQTCTAWGDVHYTGFPGRNFDYQGVGLFLLAKVGVYSITSNTKVCPSYWPGRSCNKGLIFSYPGHTIRIEENDIVIIDGVATAFTGTRLISPGVTITKNSYGTYTINYPHGTAKYTQYNRNQYGNIDIVVNAGSPVPTGVCTRSSIAKKSILSNPDEDWGNAWRISDTTSIGFPFLAGETPQNVNNPSFIQNYAPATTTDPVLRAAAIAYCARVQAELATCGQWHDLGWFSGTCVDDIIATGGPNALELGQGTVDALAVSCSNNAEEAGVPLVLPISAVSSTASGKGLRAEISRNYPYTFEVQAKDFKGNNFVGPIGGLVQVTSVPALSFTVTAPQNGKALVSFTTGPSATYNIYVKFRGTDSIADSPFRVSTVVTSAAQTTASGDGIEGPISILNTYKVTIQANSPSGTPRDNTNDVVTVSISGLGDVSPVLSEGDGKYSFTYSQFIVGPFTLSVWINSAHIAGSPWSKVANLF